ncbi:MAG TPA: signal peptidase II [Myxococcota bacterium]|nr:signal peptidase II [Myxococcota bacterium]
MDRILQGSVTDFINVGIGPVRTGIFNIADVAILLGALGLMGIEYFQSKKSPI